MNKVQVSYEENEDVVLYSKLFLAFFDGVLRGLLFIWLVKQLF